MQMWDAGKRGRDRAAHDTGDRWARGPGRDAGRGGGEAVLFSLLVPPPPLQTVAVSLQETPSIIVLQSRRLSAALQRLGILPGVGQRGWDRGGKERQVQG